MLFCVLSTPTVSSVQFVAPIARCFESGFILSKPMIPFVWFASVPGGVRTFFMTFFFCIRKFRNFSDFGFVMRNIYISWYFADVDFSGVV